jgi:hypothetical protein
MAGRKGFSDVGGQPLFFAQTGVVADTPADITVVCGFIPDYICFIPDLGATAPQRYEWFLGMTESGEAMLTNGADGVTSLDADDTFELDSDGKSFVICAEIQAADDDSPYHIQCFRYSQ